MPKVIDFRDADDDDELFPVPSGAQVTRAVPVSVNVDPRALRQERPVSRPAEGEKNINGS
jgi:hypothetical protein